MGLTHYHRFDGLRGEKSKFLPSLHWRAGISALETSARIGHYQCDPTINFIPIPNALNVNQGRTVASQQYCTRVDLLDGGTDPPAISRSC
jgi:hypothetical protein